MAPRVDPVQSDSEAPTRTGVVVVGGGSIGYLCKTRDEMAKREAWLEHARPYQLDTRLLSRDETAQLLSGLAGDWQGALYTPSDGRGEPQKAAPAIAEAARRVGATILT